jgi:hypothetical protein
MRKRRHILRKDWSDLRSRIAEVIDKSNLDPKKFRPLSVYDGWEEIESRIYSCFCSNSVQHTKRLWLWSHFKLDTVSVYFKDNLPEYYLDKLIDEQEVVWYVVNETINEKTKFWFYEGTINGILKIIENAGFNELYIVSKKYEWLICINHHDYLIATGDVMPEKLSKIAELANTY